MTREDYDRAMRLHFWAPYELISQILPEMRLWGGGRIVNITCRRQGCHSAFRALQRQQVCAHRFL